MSEVIDLFSGKTEAANASSIAASDIYSPENLLKQALDTGLAHVVIAGSTKEGKLFLVTSESAATANWILDFSKQQFLNL